MRLARVRGTATASIRHPSMVGQRLLICQLLNCDFQAEGDPVIVIDKLNAGLNDLVYLSSDSKRIGQMVNDDFSPVRWYIMGIIDP